MLWGNSKRVDLYLSGANLSWRAGEAHELHSFGPGDSWQSLLTGLLEKTSPGSHWHVWLGGRLCRLSIEAPVEGARRVEEAEAALALAAPGEGGPRWSFRLNAWPQRAAGWVTAAIPAGLIEELDAMLRSKQQRLHAVKPWWSLPSKTLKYDVAMVDDESITYWRLDAKHRVSEAATLTPVVVEQQRTSTLSRLDAEGAIQRCDLILDSSTNDHAFGWRLHGGVSHLA